MNVTKLTKKQAVAEHRNLWNWIADETEKQKRCVDKWEYFLEKGFTEAQIPYQNCFCCEYVLLQSESKDADDCVFCPVKWNFEWNFTNESFCPCTQGEFGLWRNAFKNRDYKKAAKIARKIANLPVAETPETEE